MSLWTEQDLLVLKASYDLLPDIGRASFVLDSAISARSGVELERCRASIKRLRAETFLVAQGVWNQSGDMIVKEVTNDGLRALKEWPSGSELAEALPAILRALADKEADSKRRSAFAKAAELVESLGVEIAASIISRVMLGG